MRLSLRLGVTDSSVRSKALCNLKGKLWRATVPHQPGSHGPKHQFTFPNYKKCHASIPEIHSHCQQEAMTPPLTSAAPGSAGMELAAEARGKADTDPEGLPDLSPRRRSLLPTVQQALKQGAVLFA